jgi:hypothetical protein
MYSKIFDQYCLSLEEIRRAGFNPPNAFRSNLQLSGF